MSVSRPRLLRAGDDLLLEGELHTIEAVSATEVRLVNVPSGRFSPRPRRSPCHYWTRSASTTPPSQPHAVLVLADDNDRRHPTTSTTTAPPPDSASPQ